MPYDSHRVDGVQVRNTKTGRIHAKSTTAAKARRQLNLLRAVKHGFKPTGKMAQDRRKKKKHKAA